MSIFLCPLPALPVKCLDVIYKEEVVRIWSSGAFYFSAGVWSTLCVPPLWNILRSVSSRSTSSLTYADTKCVTAACVRTAATLLTVSLSSRSGFCSNIQVSMTWLVLCTPEFLPVCTQGQFREEEGDLGLLRKCHSLLHVTLPPEEHRREDQGVLWGDLALVHLQEQGYYSLQTESLSLGTSWINLNDS